MDNKFARAYKEVLEIINHLSEEDYNRIPKEKIDFFKDNLDKDYNFTLDPKLELSKQRISKEAKAIIVVLYQDYFATEKQKVTINEILRLNQIKAEQEKRKKYNPSNLFKNANNN